MKWSPYLRAAVAASLLCGSVRQSSGVEVLGQSADKKYQIRPSYYIDPGNVGTKYFHLAVYDTKLQRQIFVILGAYDAPHGMDGIVLWHPSLPIFAVRVGESRRYGHTELYSIQHGKVTMLRVPNYQRNALEAVHATMPFNVMFDNFNSWRGNRLILELQFDASKKRSPDGITSREDYNGSYLAEVTLLVKPARTPPSVKLQHLSVNPA